MIRQDRIEETAVEQDADTLKQQLDDLGKGHFYCCSNHDPKHCGTIEEVEKLAASGCSGFTHD